MFILLRKVFQLFKKYIKGKEPKSLSWYLYIPLLIISLIYLCYNFFYHKYTFPSTNIDEASFFSPAYNMAKFSRLSTDIHEGFLPGAEKYTYWIPPLYLYSLGIFLKIFSPSILYAKIFSLFLVLIGGIICTGFSVKRELKILLPTLLFICPFVIIGSSYIRMEAFAVMLSLLLFLVILKDYSIIIVSLVSGCLFMTHPMCWGIIICTGLFYFLKNFKLGVSYSLIFLIAISPYLVYVLEEPGLYVQQMDLQLKRKGAHIINSNFKYFIQTIPVLIFSFYLFFTSELEMMKKKFFLGSLIITYALYLKSGEFNYHIYLIPFLIASFSLPRKLHENRSTFQFSYVFIFCFFIVLNYIKYRKNEIPNDSIYKSILTQLNKNQNWKDKRIFVVGNFDISKYFIQEGQYVRRMNAVAKKPYADWIDDFNYVLLTHPPNAINPVQEHLKNWKHSTLYTDSNIQIISYQK